MNNLRYAVFVTAIPLSQEDEPDVGISVAGLANDDEVALAAQDSFAELNAQCGVSEPWLVDADQLDMIEAALPQVKR